MRGPKPKPKEDLYVPYLVRFPEPLLEWVREEAAEGRRPVSSQIRLYIEEALERKVAAAVPMVRRRLAKMGQQG